VSDVMTILIGITSTSWGGNEKWAAEAAAGLAERGHNASVFYTHEPVREELSRRGVEHDRVRLWGDLNPFGFGALVHLMRRRRPDAVILTKQREYWMGGNAARFAGAPLVALRLGLRRRLRDDHKRRKVFGALSDLVIVNSRVIRDELARASWFDVSKVRVLHNGVCLDPPDAERGRAALREFGVPVGARVVCGAGRLTSQKGFDNLIEAFARIAEPRGDIRLVILGEGGRRRELEKQAAATGVGSRIHLVGHRRDVRDILAAADVYALSSVNEGMANTLLEAMSVGAPIVATDVSGTAEAVRDGVEALVVPPADVSALAGAVGRLLDDGPLAERLGERARTRAAADFSMERMVSELESILREGVAAKRRAAG
jgi:glycosyltransferase involved in cell wall biosynthesis